MLSKKEMILEAITQSNSRKGIMIPEVKEWILEKYNKSLSPTTIDEKITELVQEGTVFQVNADRKRGKKFLLKKAV